MHGVGGALGVVLTGVFASTAINGVGGLIEGNWQKFGVQALGVAITIVYTFGVTFAILKVLNIFEPVRVTEESRSSRA